MDLISAETKAVQLMKKHGLIQMGWTFDFDRAKRRLGLCHHEDKKITISKYFTTAATEDEFKQAVLHEIAHALLPHSVGHKQEWKDKAKEIGYKGQRLAYNPFAVIRRREEAERAAAKRAVAHRKLSAAGEEQP